MTHSATTSGKSHGRRITTGSSELVERANEDAHASSRIDKLSLIPIKLIRFTVVRERTGLSRSTVWRLERRGEFPKHIKISANIVAWLEQDIAEWIRARARGLVA